MTSGEAFYQFEAANGCSTVTLLPDLNDKQWADIEKVGSELVDRLSSTQSPRVVVDLAPLSYMGSAMVALIVRLYKTVNGRNGKLVVVNQHELVFEVLKLAGLTKLWTIVETRDKAYATLGVKPGSPAVAGTATTGGTGVLVAGVLGTVGAILGLAMQFASNPMLPRKAAALIQFGCGVLGIVVGVILLNQTGARRNIGIALLAVCVLALVGGIIFAPDQKETSAKTSQSPPATAAPAGDAPSTSSAASPTTTAAKAPTPAAEGAVAEKSAPAKSVMSLKKKNK